MHGQDEDANGRELPADAGRGIHAGRPRHADVHDDHIRGEGAGEANGFPPVRCFPDHFKVWLSGEEGAEAGPEHGMVIGQ
jgi:hypothetical protein